MGLWGFEELNRVSSTKFCGLTDERCRSKKKLNEIGENRHGEGQKR